MSRLSSAALLVLTSLGAWVAPGVATAEEPADDDAPLTARPLVWVQTFASIAPAYDFATGTQAASAVELSGKLGLRLAVGMGRWSDEGHVLPGFAGELDRLREGFVVGGWVREETARTALGEFGALSFGGTLTLFEQSRHGRVVASSLDLGRRLSTDAQGRARTHKGVPISQVVATVSEQVALYESVFIGPTTFVGFGSDHVPWQVGFGLEISTAL